MGLWEAEDPTWALREGEGYYWPAAYHTHHISMGSLWEWEDKCSANTSETSMRGRGA